MTSLSRRLARADLARAAAVMLGAAFLLALAAYVFAATTSGWTPGAVAAGLAVLAVAGSGLLYAWRPGTGGLGD